MVTNRTSDLPLHTWQKFHPHATINTTPPPPPLPSRKTVNLVCAALLRRGYATRATHQKEMHHLFIRLTGCENFILHPSWNGSNCSPSSKTKGRGHPQVHAHHSNAKLEMRNMAQVENGSKYKMGGTLSWRKHGPNHSP